MENIKREIRGIPDFPIEGILFRDITTLLRNAELFHKTIDIFAERFEEKSIDIVVGIEARGFTLASALAYKLNAGLVIVRRSDKLPYLTHHIDYKMAYAHNSLEIHQDAIMPGERILIVDDMLATGGTASATIGLIKNFEVNIVGLAFLMELTFLSGREKLTGYDIFSIIKYEE